MKMINLNNLIVKININIYYSSHTYASNSSIHSYTLKKSINVAHILSSRNQSIKTIKMLIKVNFTIGLPSSVLLYLIQTISKIRYNDKIVI